MVIIENCNLFNDYTLIILRNTSNNQCILKIDFGMVRFAPGRVDAELGIVEGWKTVKQD